ncbi:MAG: hypothetical protein HGB03_01210 [Candidatus Yonathbacteria bacterium]|nr:hypothetical protein [Candidatus Yonathbacteria bacterium]NTW47883.1 hypothetical protein [Candidatus Yonathbacteria bacterium]
MMPHTVTPPKFEIREKIPLVSYSEGRDGFVIMLQKHPGTTTRSENATYTGLSGYMEGNGPSIKAATNDFLVKNAVLIVSVTQKSTSD